jgi:hypothetical protein
MTALFPYPRKTAGIFIKKHGSIYTIENIDHPCKFSLLPSPYYSFKTGPDIQDNVAKAEA